MSDREEIHFEVGEDFDKLRADKVVQSFKSEMSRTQIQKLFEKGLVLCNDQAITKNQRLSIGDKVQVEIPASVPLEVKPVPMDLEILFEDEDFLALNKQPGIVVHPGAGTGEDTLVHGLLHHCKGDLSGIGGVERPGIVHRLDKETSGVIVVAKSDKAFQGLAKQFAERTTEKTYLTLAMGIEIMPSGQVKEPIGRHKVHRNKMAIREDGRSAHSTWRTLEKWDERFSLFEVQIHTGRTHQIRVHLSHLNHPICGDKIYGWRTRQNEDFPVPRVMLHAWQLKIKHPISGEEMLIKAPMPKDFMNLREAFTEKFKTYTKTKAAERVI